MSKNDQPLNIKLSETEVGNLWKRYGDRLHNLASRFLGSSRRIEDSQGIANAAFLSLIKQIGSEEMESEEGIDGLWPLAMGIARNKAKMAIRKEAAQKRGGGIDFSPTEGVADNTSDDPSFFVELEELVERLDKYTNDTPVVRQIVERRMQGQTSKDIALELGLSQSKVSRRLAELRQFLSEC